MKKKWWIVIGVIVVAGAVVAWFATRGPEVTEEDKKQADETEEEVDDVLDELNLEDVNKEKENAESIINGEDIDAAEKAEDQIEEALDSLEEGLEEAEEKVEEAVKTE